jgi:probable rRNA maturation factor
MKYRIHLHRDVPGGPSARSIQAAARAALAQARARTGSLTVVLTDSRRMRRLNARFAGEDRVTDVLSFPTDTHAGARGRPYFGDIVIALPRARRQARQRRVPLLEELALLTVHGTLHLLGFDHRRPAQARRMWKTQASALRRLGLDPDRLSGEL